MALNKTLMRAIYRKYLQVKSFNDNTSLMRKIDHQDRALKEIVRFASTHSAFYADKLRAHGLESRSIGIDAISTLPVTTRDELVANYERNLTRSLRRGDVLCRSSGTTGVPFRYVLSREEYHNERAVGFWGWTRAGWMPGDPMGFLDNVGLGGLIIKIKNLLRHIHCESMYNISPRTVGPILRRFRTHRIKWLRTVPSAVFDLVRISVEGGISEAGIDTLRGVFTTGETLYDFQRKEIEAFFGVPVFDQYGAGDGGFSGFQFGPGSVYVCDMYRSYAETLDDGSLVVTSLDNHTFPFIRYRVGDMGRLRYSNDLQSLVLDELQGRIFESVLLPNGRRIQALYFTHLLNDLDLVSRFKVVQRDPNHLVFYLQPSRPGIEDSIRDTVLEHLDKEISSQLKVEFEFSDSIPRTKRKFCYVERGF